MGEPAPVLPQHLGRYEILRHLATGGMAEVLLARVIGADGVAHHVVLKRIRGDQARDPQFVKMFLHEASLTTWLNHPNVVKVYDIGEEHGEYYFAMEYVHGEDLRKVLVEITRRHDKVPIHQVISIMSGAAAGLHHAHERLGSDGAPLGIVHRDVSPANILVGYDGSVKVADFGIAKAVLRQVETRSGTLKGKVSYMSPEQVTGAPIDRRSDVFALGIVLYELTTARRLFKGDNDFLVMSSIVQGNIPRPSKHRADVPSTLEDIIMKALTIAPEGRFQTAEELRVALEKFAGSIGMRPSNASVADYMKKLFGMRAEPWLVTEEQTITTTIDFDGSDSGVVRPDPMIGMAQGAPSSLIVLAQSSAPVQAPITIGSAPAPTAQTAVAQPYPLAPPRAREWTGNESTPTAGNLRLATPRRVKPRRRMWIVGGVAAVIAIPAILIISQSSGSSKTTPSSPKSNQAEVVPPTAPPPPIVPTPAPVEPPPTVATPDPVPADPPPEIAKPTVVKPAIIKPSVVKPRPAPIAVSEAKDKPPKKPVTPPPKKSNWDPNSLFPK